MSTILIVEARFYPHLNDMLLEGARNAIEAAGHKHETITVPGALELPAAISLAAKSGRFCAFVALGVVIRGETYHFEIVSEESARALMDLGPDLLAAVGEFVPALQPHAGTLGDRCTSANSSGDR